MLSASVSKSDLCFMPISNLMTCAGKSAEHCVSRAAEGMDFARQVRLNIENMAPLRSRISELPNEVLEHIMGYLDGVPALHAFVEAHSQAKLLFHARPRLMLLSAIRNCSMALHIKQLACTVMYVRSQPDELPTLGHLINTYVYWKLRNEASQKLLEASLFLAKSDSVALLYDFADVYRQIAEAEESLIRVQLPKTADRIRRLVDRECLSWPIHCPREGRLEKPPSPTELHRIRRALWRLWFYFRIFHDLQGDKNYRSPYKNLHAQNSFFHHLTIWELEEIECVYYHLQHQTRSLWRKTCTSCNQQVLPDIIYNGICKECRGGEKIRVKLNGEERKEDPHTDSFSHACSEFRNYMYRTEPFADWTDTPAAKHPNAGFQHSPKYYLRVQSLGCLFDWGYCMWDESRFKAWHLVENPDRQLQDEAFVEKLQGSGGGPKLRINRSERAVKGWWTDGGIHYEDCARCGYYFE